MPKTLSFHFYFSLSFGILAHFDPQLPKKLNISYVAIKSACDKSTMGRDRMKLAIFWENSADLTGGLVLLMIEIIMSSIISESQFSVLVFVVVVQQILTKHVLCDWYTK